MNRQPKRLPFFVAAHVNICEHGWRDGDFGYSGAGLLLRQHLELQRLSRPLDLHFNRHRRVFVGADHLLVQPYPILTVEEVELDPLLPHRGMQLYRDLRRPEMNRAFPDRCRM